MGWAMDMKGLGGRLRIWRYVGMYVWRLLYCVVLRGGAGIAGTEKLLFDYWKIQCGLGCITRLVVW